MKKILSIAAVFSAASIMLGASVFACPLKQEFGACTIPEKGIITGAAAPVSYIVAPVQQRTYLPACNSCSNKTQKTMFQKIMTPFTGLYNTVISPFTNLYD